MYRIKEIFPNCKHHQLWEDTLENTLPMTSINTKLRVCAFLAQCGHESAEFNVLEENLNYSASALLRVFPRYFNTGNVEKFARKPSLIANKVYGNRMGNIGPEDGWKYRGRGLIMLTGKSNYSKCSIDLFDDDRLIDNPDMLLEPETAVLTSIWFWERNDLNHWADLSDIKTLTKKINGGYHGLENRVKFYNRAMGYLD